ncbi:MAG: acetyl-CoA carboxylase biotin carboxyl carrier protein [Oceanidesulfovibrio sp.]
MDNTRIEEIIAIAEKYDLDALEVEDETGAVRVVRRSAGSAPAQAVREHSEKPDPYASGAPNKRSSLPEGVEAIPSPMVGIFSTIPPGEDCAPVQQGDCVTTGQALGYVEAMKMSTEVSTPLAGTLVEILAADGQAVQFGDPLFLIKPSIAEK